MGRTFTIFATSDVHGYVVPYNYSDQKEVNAGLARIATLVREQRDENTLLIDNGDGIQGSPMAFYHNLMHSSETHPVAKVMSRMQYDYMNLGNHDFNEGQDVMERFIRDCKTPCICRNVKKNGTQVSDDYVVHTFPNGVRIALFGIVTQHIPNWEKPVNLEGLEFVNAFESAKDAVEKIKKQETVDAIVGVYHGGFERDLMTGEPTENLNGENLGYKMCHEIEGLDVLITGHQHRSIAQMCCGTLVTQTACNGREVAKLTFDVDEKKGTAQLIVPTCEPAKDILDTIEEIETECQKWLDQPLGTCKEDLLVKDGFQARLHKHPIVSFMNQVQFSDVKGDFSAVALFNDAKGFPQKITMRDIVSTYVYSNTLTVIRMNGHILKEFLEKCAEYFEVENGEIVVSPRFAAPKPAHFNYDMVDGLDYTIQVSNPIGERVISMSKDGKPLDLEKEYDLIMSNYRAGGGGDFDMVKKGTVVYESQNDMVECLAQYILEHPEIEIDHRDNITVIL